MSPTDIFVTYTANTIHENKKSAAAGVAAAQFKNRPFLICLLNCFLLHPVIVALLAAE